MAVLLTGVSVQAQATHFLPNHLAVLRAGDGTFDLDLKQSPVFIDQFDPAASNASPSFTVRIPTNGASSFFFNGHAATEGNLNRSSNGKLLTFAGYGGVDLLKITGTAARLDIDRGICTVDNDGNVHTYLYKHESPETKVNPRGAVTDGNNNFWGCGNAHGTFYFNPSSASGPIRFGAFPNSRAIRIVNNILYATMNQSDANLLDGVAGIYDFLPDALPKVSSAAPALAVPADAAYKKIVGFDINPAGNIAYMSDVSAGVQKYVKSGDTWKFAYNFSIPQNIPKEDNNAAGCFGLVVDFGGSNPIIYATTTEGYGGSVNSNRVVRIVDTGASSAVTTIVQAGSTNIAYRGVDFTPK